MRVRDGGFSFIVPPLDGDKRQFQEVIFSFKNSLTQR